MIKTSSKIVQKYLATFSNLWEIFRNFQKMIRNVRMNF